MSSQKLFAACESGRVGEVTRLLDAGADVDYVNKDYRDFTPLIVATWNGDSPVVRVLLQRGAEVNAGDNYGQTALHWACWKGAADCVEALLEHEGIDVNRQNNAEDTPLHRACSMSKPGAVQQLLEAGARTDIRDRDGKLPVDRVPEGKAGTQEIIRMLEEAGKAGTDKQTLNTSLSAGLDVRPKSTAAADSKAAKEKTIASKLLESSGGTRKRTENTKLVHQINDDVSVLTSTLTNSITKLEKQIEELTAQINTKDAAIAKKDATLEKKDQMLEQMLLQMHDLQNLIVSLKSEVQTKSADLSKGVNELIQKSSDYFASNCQVNHLNDIIYFQMFERICEKIRYLKKTWEQLGRLLFKNFPEGFVTQLLHDINSRSYTTNKDRCMELLLQWKLYSYSSSDSEKVEELLAALRNVMSAKDAAELEKNVYSLLTQHQQKTQQQMEGSLTDKGLDALAGQIGSEWHTLGLELEFSSPELYHLEEDFPAARRRNFQMLLSWRNRETGFPVMKLGRLAEALGRCGRGDLAKALN